MPIYADIRIGNLVSRRHLFFPMAYLMGDSLSNDKMCGHYLLYSNVQRICHACDVTLECCDDVHYQCNYLSMTSLQMISNRAIMKLFDVKEWTENDDNIPCTPNQLIRQQMEILEQLKGLSHHIHNNAFKKVWLGNNPHGILGATPHDLMHAFLHGILRYIISTMMDPLLLAEKSRLDSMVDQSMLTFEIFTMKTLSTL